jgi:AcrR family transcriptional regulator
MLFMRRSAKADGWALWVRIRWVRSSNGEALPKLSARHTANTRSALIRAGRQPFTKKGYDATSTDEIVERSSLSKGALYHHFTSKHELFRAVFVDVEAALIERSAAETTDLPVPGSSTSWEESMTFFLTYLDAASDDAAFRQIVLIDGPSVLGWELWREIQVMLAPDRMETWIQNAIDQGLIAPHPVLALAHLLVAAMNEAVIYVAHAPDPAAARSEVAPVVRALFEGLLLESRG